MDRHCDGYPFVSTSMSRQGCPRSQSYSLCMWEAILHMRICVLHTAPRLSSSQCWWMTAHFSQLLLSVVSYQKINHWGYFFTVVLYNCMLHTCVQVILIAAIFVLVPRKSPLLYDQVSHSRISCNSSAPLNRELFSSSVIQPDVHRFAHSMQSRKALGVCFFAGPLIESAAASQFPLCSRV